MSAWKWICEAKITRERGQRESVLFIEERKEDREGKKAVDSEGRRRVEREKEERRKDQLTFNLTFVISKT